MDVDDGSGGLMVLKMVVVVLKVVVVVSGRQWVPDFAPILSPGQPQVIGEDISITDLLAQPRN